MLPVFYSYLSASFHHRMQGLFPFNRHLKFIIQVFIFTLVLLSETTNGFAQTPYSFYGKQSNALIKLLDLSHYQPVTLDKRQSRKIYWKFIHELDPRGLYFCLNDLRVINEYQNMLDDEISNCSGRYLEQVTQLYRNKLISTDSMVGRLLRKPTDFSVSDTIFYTLSDSITYTSNETELERRWRRFLKYEVLLDLFTPDDSDKVNPFGMDTKELLKREPLVRTRLLKRTQRKIERILQHGEGFENYVASEFMNAITACYDPHSEFFSDNGKDNFVSLLSADDFSFGISFEENDDGDPQIVHLAPGGSAWKSNQLNDGDILVKLKSIGSSSHNIPFNNLTQAEEILHSKTNRILEFTVRKPNGQMRNIVLEKTKVRSDENAIKSYILTGEKRIGYIALPSFYTEWGTSSPLGCANDVAKEILKLQAEQIEGLILDLRFNGGGSVYEAIGLAGLFIDEGPITIYKERNGKPMLLKDLNRGTAYDGPLLIMVNGMSASASEIFAGSIQDYNRGIIAGSPTYGKASGQTIIPLDTVFHFPEIVQSPCTPDKNERKNLGYAKITVEKFYNLRNGTHQKKGIQPDVHLPDPFYFNEYRESSLPEALSSDSIVKKVFYHPLPPLPLELLASQSNARQKASRGFNRFRQLNDSLRDLRKIESKVILKPENFKKEEKKSFLLAEAMDKLQSDSSSIYRANNNAFEEQILAMDPYSKETNLLLLKNIQKDIFIEESYNVLLDLIRLKK